MRKLWTILIAALALSVTGCGYNTFQTGDEQIKASWSEVVNQYQRRADLVPNLVNTVKGEAKFEQDTLTQVIGNKSENTNHISKTLWSQSLRATRLPKKPFANSPAVASI